MIEISCDMLLRRERKQLFPRRDDGPGDSIGLCTWAESSNMEFK